MAAVSTSAPIIAATAAPALAIAAWRNLMAAGVLLPVALADPAGGDRSLGRRGWGLSLLAGTLLAGHFAAWVPSVTLTSVASSTALVATQPVWAALLARAAGQHVGRPVWTGILVAVAGAAHDHRRRRDALRPGGRRRPAGRCSAASSPPRYVTAGRGGPGPDQHHLVHDRLLLGLRAAAGAGLPGLAGQPLAGYPASTWVKLAALTVGAQLLGHSLINVVLRSTSPTVVSLAILFEAPGAALIAAVWLGQLPPVAALPGIVVLLAGLAIVIRAGARAVAGRVTG